MNKDELSAKLLRAVGHPLRLRIIKMLHEFPSLSTYLWFSQIPFVFFKFRSYKNLSGACYF